MTSERSSVQITSVVPFLVHLLTTSLLLSLRHSLLLHLRSGGPVGAEVTEEPRDQGAGGWRSVTRRGTNRVKRRHEERYDQRSRLTRRRHGDEPQEPPIIDRLCCVQPSSLPLVSLLATLVVLLARFLGCACTRSVPFSPRSLHPPGPATRGERGTEGLRKGCDEGGWWVGPLVTTSFGLRSSFGARTAPTLGHSLSVVSHGVGGKGKGKGEAGTRQKGWDHRLSLHIVPILPLGLRLGSGMEWMRRDEEQMK